MCLKKHWAQIKRTKIHLQNCSPFLCHLLSSDHTGKYLQGSFGLVFFFWLDGQSDWEKNKHWSMRVKLIRRETILITFQSPLYAICYYLFLAVIEWCVCYLLFVLPGYSWVGLCLWRWPLLGNPVVLYLHHS